MSKIRRNEPCPCGSGLKYKRCCLTKHEARALPSSSMRQLKLSLLHEIEKVQNAAKHHEEIVRELGVFIFCATSEGDAWLLEITESDAVKLADKGLPLEVPVEENPETIEINWSHTFAIRNRQFYLRAYDDNREICLTGMPAQRIHAAHRRIRKKYSDDQLNQVHIDQPAAG